MYLPLQIVWPGVLVFFIRAERTDVARRVVHQTMPDHFVLALEPLPAFTAWAIWDGAVVVAYLAVDVPVRAV